MRRWFSWIALLTVPLAVVLWALDRSALVNGQLTTSIFVVALLSLIPLAQRSGVYIDTLEVYLGDRLGGLLAAAFSNIPELSLGVALLLQARLNAPGSEARGDALNIAHSMLIGSIVNNLLFTLGVAILPATLAYGRMRFAGSSDFLLGALGLAVVGLGLPTLAVALSGTAGPQIALNLSVPTSLILLVAYAAYLAFAVFGLRGGRRGREENAEDAAEAAEEERQDKKRAALRREHPHLLRNALIGLGVVSLGTAAISAVLVSVSERVIVDTPLTPLSIGFILFPIVNNLGEQAGAVTEALHGKMQEALTIPSGSAVQVALFVTPLLVLLSFPLSGFAPGLALTLTFVPAQLILLFFSVFIFTRVTQDGVVHWLAGAQVLSLYAMIAIVTAALPGR
jgi:Ca2+:H+ antiporter